MLGDHSQFAKGLLYEASARVPLILMPTSEHAHLSHNQVDDGLVVLHDIMPTLFDLVGNSSPNPIAA